jgi:hypothetical protein
MEKWSVGVMGKKDWRDRSKGFAILQYSITPVLQTRILDHESRML